MWKSILSENWLKFFNLNQFNHVLPRFLKMWSEVFNFCLSLTMCPLVLLNKQEQKQNKTNHRQTNCLLSSSVCHGLLACDSFGSNSPASGLMDGSISLQLICPQMIIFGTNKWMEIKWANNSREMRSSVGFRHGRDASLHGALQRPK